MTIRFLYPAIILTLVILNPGVSQAQPAGTQTPRVLSFDVSGQQRSVSLYVPRDYDSSATMPLVFNLHGSGSSAEAQESFSGMSGLADSEGFVIAGGMAVYENSIGWKTWNADLDSTGVSDVEYIRAAIEIINDSVAIDRKRIYATGFSGGARMSSRLACELSDVLAAVAPVSGVQFAESCSPETPIPLMTIHSQDDRLNTYNGGNAEQNPSWVAGVEYAVSQWAFSNGCRMAPSAERLTESVTRLNYDDCDNSADIVFYRLDNGGHTWPGSPMADEIFEKRGATVNMEIDASELIWEFFEDHTLP